ncbi:MAG: ribonuclease P protein component [Elusimicrobia bacterium]|nr:ribonuclease P protein component [Elusimicrobiota bacterium]
MSLGTSSLGPDARLRTRKDFDRVFTLGRKAAGRSMILWHGTAPGAGRPRLGVAISARVGCAVARNRFKRLAREAFRLNRAKLRDGSDLVVYIRPGCRWKSLSGAQEDFLGLCAKEGLLTP